MQTAHKLLDEGLKLLATRQKYIKIINRSDYGWVMVRYYQDDQIASDTEDEKKLGRVEKEARKDSERQARKSCLVCPQQFSQFAIMFQSQVHSLSIS